MAEFDTIYYDGACGLCHRGVKFALRRDRDGSRFVYAPLGGETFEHSLTEDQRAGLPDSIVVHTAGGGVLLKSDATLHVLRRLGGGWKPLAAAGRLVPRGLRDFAYDRVAAVRHRVFKKPDDACPLVPPNLRDRFKP